MEPNNPLRTSPLTPDASLDITESLRVGTPGEMTSPDFASEHVILAKSKAPAPEPVGDLGETEQAVPDQKQDLPGVDVTATTVHVGKNFKD